MEDEDYSYELKGIVNHYGNAIGGHYYSYIKVDGEWKEFNDSFVKDFNICEIEKNCFGS